MLGRLVRAWWGDFSKEELEKFALLSLIFGLIIGVYWYLRPLKDSIFMAVVGENYIPKAKFLSLFIVFPLVLIYSKLVDIFPRQKMFYALCGIYSIIGLCFAFIMNHSTIGLSNAVASPDRWWGWAWYVFIESFGSLVVALFWAFATDITAPESAARGFPLVALGGQVGNILGPLGLSILFSRFAHFELGPEGELPLEAVQHSAFLHSISVAIASLLIASIILLVRYFMLIMPKDQLQGFQSKEAHKHKHEEAEPGFFEGLKILISSPYLIGIFGIITFYEIIVTVLDFNFKTLVKAEFPDAHATTLYLASYGMWVGIASMLSILLGINKIQRVLGLGVSLALLPLMIAGAVLTFKSYPHLSMLFIIMVLSKAVNYALNQPSMKQLYIPTSKEAKYKSQAFIEMYGSRGSKAAGSSINLLRKPLMDQHGALAGLTMFITYCTYASLGIVAVWFFVALYLGRTFNKAIKEKHTIC